VNSATIGIIFNVQALAKSQPSTDPPTTVTTNSTTSQNFLSVPVETNQFSQGLAFGNVVVYFNSSDGHYHLKGLAKNMLPETRSNSIHMTIDIQDKSTGTTVKTLNGNLNAPIDPGQVVPFDVDIGYTAAQGNQLPFVKVYITYT
jgi:hypothetical protein